MRYSKVLPVKDAVFTAEDYAVRGGGKNLVIKRSVTTKSLLLVFVLFSVCGAIGVYMNSEDLDLSGQIIYTVIFLSFAITISIMLPLLDSRKTLIIYENGFFQGKTPLKQYINRQTPVIPWKKVKGVDVTVPYHRFKVNKNLYLSPGFNRTCFLTIKEKDETHYIFTPQLLEALNALNDHIPEKFSDNAKKYIGIDEKVEPKKKGKKKKPQ